MTRYATAFKGLRVVKLKKKDKKIQDALKSIRNGELCSSLSRFAPGALKDSDIVLLAYNSEGVVKGVAGVNEDDDLYVSIICNAMGKKNRGEGYAPGKGLLDLLKKIATQKKKPLVLSALPNVINYYKRFGFKQHPKSNYKGNLIWQWNPSYSRARRFEYQSVNSNYNSNNNKPTIYRRTRSKVSPTGSNRSGATVKRRKSKASPTRSKASPTSSNRSNATFKLSNLPSPVSRFRQEQLNAMKTFIPTTNRGRKQQMKRFIANEKESKKNLKGYIIDAKYNNEKQHYKREKKDRKKYIKKFKVGIRELNERIQASKKRKTPTSKRIKK